jgi:uncharacterized protein with HEPN domain
MPSKHPARRFLDILDNIDAIDRHVASLDEAGFFASDLVMNAVERCLSRISEAAVKLDVEAERLAPGIPWPDIRGLGNHLRHGYDTVEPADIWAIVKTDLAPLRDACLEALRRLGHDSP